MWGLVGDVTTQERGWGSVEEGVRTKGRGQSLRTGIGRAAILSPKPREEHSAVKTLILDFGSSRIVRE